jgi:hypothetical protein
LTPAATPRSIDRPQALSSCSRRLPTPNTTRNQLEPAATRSAILKLLELTISTLSPISKPSNTAYDHTSTSPTPPSNLLPRPYYSSIRASPRFSILDLGHCTTFSCASSTSFDLPAVCTYRRRTFHNISYPSIASVREYKSQSLLWNSSQSEQSSVLYQ